MRIQQVTDAFGRSKLIKMWEPEGYPFEAEAMTQIENMAKMPFVFKHLAVMADAHAGKGSTVGTVIATKGAIIPAAVGVDIGCGMMALRTSLTANDLPDTLSHIRGMIEAAVPHGRGNMDQIRAGRDPGSWTNPTNTALAAALPLHSRYAKIIEKHPKIAQKRAPVYHMGTLGTGNHFIEICLDEEDRVWVMLHSGSRGIGNAIGTYFINKAKEEMLRYHIAPYLPDEDLSYLVEHTEVYDDYVEAVGWAQDFALANRTVMMQAVLGVMRQTLPPFLSDQMAINCFRGDTRFITSEGLRAFSDVAGSTVKVVTNAGQWVDAEIKSFGEQRLVKLTLGRYDLTKTIYTTAGHRWFLDPLQRERIEKTTIELVVGDRLASQRPERTFDGFDLRSEFRGFTYGDGSTNSAHTSLANFCGPKQGLVNRYSGLEGNEPRQYGETTRITGLPGLWKREVKDLFLASPNEIAGWLAGYFAADGDIDKTGRPTITSADRHSLESYRDLCWRIGIATYPIRYVMRTGYGEEETPLYLMGLSRNDLPEEFFIREDHRIRLRRADERFNWKVVAIEETDLVEEVFCAEVPATHAFVLEDGILTSNCHHNYVTKEQHYGEPVLVTRKGAVQAREGTLGIIPGSMGTGSFIVRGKGNHHSFNSCSHGAGRVMSRTKAKKMITMEQHAEAMKGIEARLDADILDESPAAYKPLGAVMAAQDDLVEIVHRLRQILNVKG